MVKIYTRGGDKGETSLLDGTRTTKTNPRVDLYGSVDELNSFLGFGAALLQQSAHGEAVPTDRAQELVDQLHHIQRDLFQMCSILANPQRSRELASSAAKLPFAAATLESHIDGMQAELPPLSSFILPGGSVPAGALHISRSVCRRVERRAVEVDSQHAIPPGVMVYLNRLSDYLFVAARWANHILGVEDEVWSQPEAWEDPTS
ncbi:MAG: cob(I)yrinic acid a,c-diamide adenosyltransferase [bacterium]